MITTFAYDPTQWPTTVDPRPGVQTLVFQTSNGELAIAQTPFDPPPPLGLILRALFFMNDAEKKWDAYCALLVHNDWSRREGRYAARCACHLYGVAESWVEDVMQEAQLALCRLFAAKVDLIRWLKDPLERFESWFRKFLFNASNAAARKMFRATRRVRFVDGQSPSDDFLLRLADDCATDPGTLWDRMQAKLARYPERTRAVLLLLNDGQTWAEVAETLDITVGKARYAVDSHLEELQRDFAEFL